MTTCPASTLLPAGAGPALADALLLYPSTYDEVFNAVGSRLVAQGAASKLDLAALITWKHIQTATWMERLLRVPDAEVREATAAALAAGLTDQQRVMALAPLPGFGAGGPVTSVFFAAWNPSRYAVYDKVVEQHRPKAVTPACPCSWANLPDYWEHVRRIAAELSVGAADWTPRMVDRAMLNL
jgi:hypothetical protein